MNKAVVWGLIALLTLPGPAQAETLRDVLAYAYRTSALLHGQQALQRATTEGAVQARSGWLPQIGVSASGGY